MKKLAIITTHPIQYNAPIFRMLAARENIAVKVFYTWENSKKGVYDQKFKQQIQWDIPLLEGYEYTFVRNTSSDQGSHHYKGIVNPTLVQEIGEWQADAVLVYGWKFKSHYQALSYFKGQIPVYFRGDSTLIGRKNSAKEWVRKFVLTQVYKKIDKAFYVGKHNYEYYRLHGVKESQLVHARHAIENERFYKKISNIKQIRAELGIEQEDIVFLYSGKFEAKKNPILLLDVALKILEEFESGVCFLFVGSGDLERKLKQKANDHPKIIFQGFKNQSYMPIVYQLSDVFVLPSQGSNETWGLAVNEAMASGKAVIVSDKVGCAPDLIHENGFTFHSGNFEQLSDSIRYFINNTDQIRTKGLKSKEIIKAFNFKSICEAIENELDL